MKIKFTQLLTRTLKFSGSAIGDWYTYYSPQLGMYYQADPLGLEGGDYNLYRYANGSPTRYIDPYGLYSWNEAGSDLANFWIGVGDIASFGITSWIRKQDWYGGDCFTDKSSGAYKAGEIMGFISSAIAYGRFGNILFTKVSASPIWKAAELLHPSKLKSIGNYFKMHDHHMIPLQSKNYLPKGMNIENYRKLIPAGKHNLKPFGIHTGKDNYNKAWKVFFKSTKSPNEEQILENMYELEKYYRLERYKWVKP